MLLNLLLYLKPVLVILHLLVWIHSALLSLTLCLGKLSSEDYITCAPLACPVACIPAGHIAQEESKVRAFLPCLLHALCHISGSSCVPPQLYILLGSASL